ncbi:MAG: phosphoribosylanthranilate isomerase [Saprospiraceae bacterium]
MIVKVCGLTPKTELDKLGDLSINWGGLIFVKESPRFVGKDVFALPKEVMKVGVFKNESFHVILRTAQLWRFRTVQLHGAETPEDCARLRKAGLKIIKAISVSAESNLNDTSSPYVAAVDYFLFDSPGGGTGTPFDWKILETYTGDIPFLLAGGIAPGFGESLLKISHPQFKGIDLNSRFEVSAGHKDLSLINQFLEHELSR